MATAEAEQVQTITFESKGTHLRLIRQDAVVSVSAQGQAFNASEAVNVDFEPSGHVTFERGEQMLPDGPVKTENGRMVLDDRNQPEREWQDAIDWLLKHREFGVQFWVKGLRPGTALPLETSFMDAVMDGTFALDQSFLSALREQELRSHARPVLMAAVDNALVRVAMERERLGDQAPAEDPDRPLPSGNSPFDLGKRPVNAGEADRHAEMAAGGNPEFPSTIMASPDDPARAGGVPK